MLDKAFGSPANHSIIMMPFIPSTASVPLLTVPRKCKWIVYTLDATFTIFLYCKLHTKSIGTSVQSPGLRLNHLFPLQIDEAKLKKAHDELGYDTAEIRRKREEKARSFDQPILYCCRAQ